MKVLFIDKEGGYGGSSRSLFLLVKYLSHMGIEAVVVMKEEGPVMDWYRKRGIAVHHCPHLPLFKAVDRNNVFMLLKAFFDLVKYIRSIYFIGRLLKKYRIHILHVNAESIFILGLCCKLIFRKPAVFHIRSLFPINMPARCQAFLLSQIGDYLIFISENELDRFMILNGRKKMGDYAVVYNIAEAGEGHMLRKEPVIRQDKFKVLSLRNISYIKGTDLLLEIASELKKRDRSDMCFLVCGDERRQDRRVFQASFLYQIQEEARRMGLKNYFQFLGFQEDPLPILASSNALIRVARRNNPWGRDIIEALSYGKPVVATGTYERFVTDGENGYLFPVFDAEKIAEKLIFLADHPEIRARMGEANMEKARMLFGGHHNASKILSIYQTVSGIAEKRRSV